MDKLTAKQERFVDEYMIDLNATQAAIRAGYSEKTAQMQASRLLSNVMVQAAIEKEQKKLAAKLGITTENVARELAHIGYDDIKNYLSFRTEKVQTGSDEITGEPIYDYRTIVDMKDSDDIDTRNIQEISIGAKGEFKFKLYSKADALNALGKHLGMFVDKSEVKVEPFKIEIEVIKP